MLQFICKILELKSYDKMRGRENNVKLDGAKVCVCVALAKFNKDGSRIVYPKTYPPPENRIAMSQSIPSHPVECKPSNGSASYKDKRLTIRTKSSAKIKRGEKKVSSLAPPDVMLMRKFKKVKSCLKDWIGKSRELENAESNRLKASINSIDLATESRQLTDLEFKVRADAIHSLKEIE
ncbi:hypothetical protein QVD17_30026 [Tagetes erecta]|uniref:Uncharacterized protein n=1 Tax=Tagetes erecta TaxID=13708 RepID=A0AAD8K4V5_TARER|nr:hypothetical protein QVD17_30026 [Tagetes erecta]